jgi:hypothetical protein
MALLVIGRMRIWDVRGSTLRVGGTGMEWGIGTVECGAEVNPIMPLLGPRLIRVACGSGGTLCRIGGTEEEGPGCNVAGVPWPWVYAS